MLRRQLFLAAAAVLPASASRRTCSDYADCSYNGVSLEASQLVNPRPSDANPFLSKILPVVMHMIAGMQLGGTLYLRPAMDRRAVRDPRRTTSV